LSIIGTITGHYRHAMTKKWRHIRSCYTAFSFYGQIFKTWQGENDGYSWKN